MAKEKEREIDDRIRNRQEAEARANVTFRLKIRLMEKFRKKCESKDITMASIIEELISDYLGEK